jgi:hypothetical protein
MRGQARWIDLSDRNCEHNDTYKALRCTSVSALFVLLRREIFAQNIESAWLHSPTTLNLIDLSARAAPC